MVKVNLDYNPYLMTFNMLFNGKKPRINSLVEKYEKYPLQMWVREVPQMLYDEMNGYDFDFEFVGTELDYEDIIKSFKRKRITENQIRCYLKKQIESRTEKLKELSDLAEWLNNNHNRKFDIDKFKIENPELFYNSYSVIFFGKGDAGECRLENANISLERINDITELDNTKLEDVPIVIDTDELSSEEIQSLVYEIRKRAEVEDGQLFFIIRMTGRKVVVARLLTDLGIKRPQVISNLNDEKLSRYIEYYPVSDYIRGSIKVLRDIVDDLDLNLSKERAIFEKNNGDAIDEITKLEEKIDCIKECINKIKDINDTKVIVNWDVARNEFDGKINTWKIKKTKITDNEEADNLAAQLEQEVVYDYELFTQQIEKMLEENKESILSKCNSLYRKASGKSLDDIGGIPHSLIEIKQFDYIKDEVLKLKEERYEKKEDGIIKGVGKFLGVTNPTTSNEPKEVLVTTYYCHVWRRYVYEKTKPIIQEYIDISDKEVQDYKDNVSEKYIEKLEELLDEKNKIKEKCTEQLSEDILLSQRDSDWLVELKDRLKRIERD